MIGLNIMTQFVYWYRGWKSSDILDLKRRQLLENECNQMDESESAELPLPDYLPDDDDEQPRMNGDIDNGIQVLRANQGRPELIRDDDGLVIPQLPGETDRDTPSDHQRRMPYDLATMERLLID